MKKNSFSNWSAFRFLKASLLLLMFLPLAFASANVPEKDICTEPSPSVSSQLSTSVTFTWSAVIGATGYEGKFVKTGGGESDVQFATGTTMSFSNLPTGTYKFYFRTVCGSETSSWIITEDIIMG